MNRTTRRKSGPGLGVTAKIALATAAAAAVVTGVGVGAATAANTSTSSDAYSFEAFRETIKPWDSISVPALSCPTGYFKDVELSPGRIVPKGVEVLEPNAIGVTIAAVKSIPVTDWWNTQHHPVTSHRPRQRLLDGHELGPHQQPRAHHPTALHHGPVQGVHGPVALQLICVAHDRTSPGDRAGDVLRRTSLLAALLEGHLRRLV